MTSTTNRARCLCGSHSSIDGGRRKLVTRSVGRKLARGNYPEVGANRRYDSNVPPIEPPGRKSDRLLVPTIAETRVVIRRGDETDSPGDRDRLDRRGT